jgi:cellulose synthase/poly-beta-1,6-N-acetylglucosamine synthase-like glycosyltransferase
MEEMRRPILSVVVIGRNEGERLKRCLASVRAMRLPAGEMELIYVDSGSSDKSPQSAAEAGARVVVLQPERFTAGRARNAGWQKASAPFIFFVDGDTVVDPDFVIRALPEFQDPRLAVVFGRTRELYPNASVFHRAFDLQWQRFPPGPAGQFVGCALMRHSALEAANGFDSVLMAGEEAELSGRLRRLGFVILCVDLPMVAHDLVMTSWSQYWWRMARNAYACAEVAERFTAHELTDLHSRTRHTWVWGTLLVSSPVIAAVCSLVFASWLPLGILVVFWTVIVLSAPWKARRKAPDWLNFFVFGIHVYLKEIPRLVGQIRYYYDKHKGQRMLIEYKTCSRAVYNVDPACKENRRT